MAVAEVVVNEEVEETNSEDTNEVQFILPEKTDVAGLTKLLELPEGYGTKALKSRVKSYLYHFEMLPGCWEALLKSARTIRGEKSTRSDPIVLKRRAATQFFNTLSSTQLREICSLPRYGLDYNSYDSMEKCVAALVEKHIAQ